MGVPTRTRAINSWINRGRPGGAIEIHEVAAQIVDIQALLDAAREVLGGRDFGIERLEQALLFSQQLPLFQQDQQDQQDQQESSLASWLNTMLRDVLGGAHIIVERGVALIHHLQPAFQSRRLALPSRGC
ncbi:MAG TPA: hypothetical protein DD989_10630 [Pseudomonas sp.]|jgi:hypothetical protein|nr:hypothetical protein [Pseudomonas sp.]